MARQQPAEQLHRPHLQRLGQQRVARVREALRGDRPRLVPLELLLVDEDPHEFRHRDHGVRVVELEDDPLGQVVEVEVLLEDLLDEVTQRTGDEEVLLLQAQLLALRRGVLGVQHLGDVLGERLGAYGLGVVTGVEDLEVESLRGLGAPQSERVDAAVLVTGNHVVVGDPQHVPRRHPARTWRSLVVVRLRVAAEVHLDGRFRVRELPWATEREPGVRLLDLASVYEGLAEDAVLVADAVPDTGHAHRRQRVDEARGETAQAAVAEARLDLLGAQGGDVEAAARERLVGDVGEIRGKKRVAELAAQQVLGRQVADGLRLRQAVVTLRLQPAGHEVVAHGLGQCEVLVVDRGPRQCDALAAVQLPQELLHETVDRVRGRRHRRQRDRVGRREVGAQLAGLCGGRLVGVNGWIVHVGLLGNGLSAHAVTVTWSCFRRDNVHMTHAPCRHARQLLIGRGVGQHGDAQSVVRACQDCPVKLQRDDDAVTPRSRGALA